MRLPYRTGRSTIFIVCRAAPKSRSKSPNGSKSPKYERFATLANEFYRTEEEYEHALAIRKSVLGNEHPDVASGFARALAGRS